MLKHEVLYFIDWSIKLPSDKKNGQINFMSLFYIASIIFLIDNHKISSIQFSYQ